MSQSEQPPSGPPPQVLYVHVEGFRTKHAAIDLASKDFIRKVVSIEDYDAVVAERDVLLTNNENGAKRYYDYWQVTVQERDALQKQVAELQATPLAEQLFKVQRECVELRAAEQEHIRYCEKKYDALRDERDALKAELVEAKEFAVRETIRKNKACVERDQALAICERLAGALEAASAGLEYFQMSKCTVSATVLAEWNKFKKSK